MCPLNASASARRTPRALHGLLAVGVLAFTLAACGSGSPNASGSGSSTSTSTSSGSSSTKASTTAFTSCLKQHGVTLPSGAGGFGAGGGGAPPAGSSGTPPSFPQGNSGAGAPGSGNSKFQAALKACASLRPSGSGGFPGGSGRPNSTAFAAYSNCLKLHGVTLPTGRPSSSGAAGPSGLNASSPKVKAALKACAALRPSGSFRGSTTTTTSAS